MKLRIKILHDDAELPEYATSGAACFDLKAVGIDEDNIYRGEWLNASNHIRTVIVGTGLAFEIPTGWVMLIFSRSGHGFKNNVRLANCVGVIDSDYRGEVKVKLTADSFGGLVVRNGDRIAQAMLVQVPHFDLVEVEELTATDRGEGGFGSTGA